MEPAEALRTAENALRLIVLEILGDPAWMSARGAPTRAELEQKRTEDEKRRDGTAVMHNLIEYTETYHLAEIIRRNWGAFKPVFQDQSRTRVFLKMLTDLRNAPAHSRALMPFERDLLAGLSGQFRNQIALYRSQAGRPELYYPLIESVTDSFGRVSLRRGPAGTPHPRLQVGDELTFACSAFGAHGREVEWLVRFSRGVPPVPVNVYSASEFTTVMPIAEGDNVEFSIALTPDHVSELLSVRIAVRARGTAYWRYPHIVAGALRPTSGIDDMVVFTYAVNPPLPPPLPESIVPGLDAD